MIIYHRFFFLIVFAFSACSPFVDLDKQLYKDPSDCGEFCDADIVEHDASQQSENNPQHRVDSEDVDTAEDVLPCDCDASEDVAVDSDVDLPDSEDNVDVTQDDADAESDTGFECDENNPCSGDFICDLENRVCEPACQIHEEVCDGEDNDCDGEVDENLPLSMFYRDADGDGFGDASDSVESCLQAIDGRVLNADDCNDLSNLAHPGGHEAEIDASGANPVFVDKCHDSFDNDCDGQTDTADYDCQDRDRDTVVNGVDPIYVVDQNGNGQKESVCIVADLVFFEPWNGQTAVRQGSLVEWGAFRELFSTPADGFQMELVDGSYCYNMQNEGISTVSRLFRLVSLLNATQDGVPAQNDCETWQVFEIQTYCSLFAGEDSYCQRVTLDYNNPCAIAGSGSIGWVIGAHFDRGSIGPIP